MGYKKIKQGPLMAPGTVIGNPWWENSTTCTCAYICTLESQQSWGVVVVGGGGGVGKLELSMKHEKVEDCQVS